MTVTPPSVLLSSSRRHHHYLERKREKKRVSHFASHLNKYYLIIKNAYRPTFSTLVPNCSSVSRNCICLLLYFRLAFLGLSLFLIFPVKLSEYPAWARDMKWYNENFAFQKFSNYIRIPPSFAKGCSPF